MENDALDNIGTDDLYFALRNKGISPDTGFAGVLYDAKRAWIDLILVPPYGKLKETNECFESLACDAIRNATELNKHGISVFTRTANCPQKTDTDRAIAKLQLGDLLLNMIEDQARRLVDRNAEQWMIDCMEYEDALDAD